MAASAFKYVWPTTGILRTRLAACFVLVLAERAINLAAPIAFKHMVEVLSAITADAAAAAAADGGSLMGAVRSTLRLLLLQAAGSGASHSMHAAAAAGAAAVNATTMAAAAAGSGAPAATAAAAAAGVGAVGAGGSVAPFWVLFYPWVFIYLAAFLLRGGSGSEGLLANIRDILWIPITQVRGPQQVRWFSSCKRGHLASPCMEFCSCLLLEMTLSVRVAAVLVRIKWTSMHAALI
jgi:ATP-binding cassette subfamily B (MDR/TAP) protein 6